jgi:hypothetical protein
MRFLLWKDDIVLDSRKGETLGRNNPRTLHSCDSGQTLPSSSLGQNNTGYELCIVIAHRQAPSDKFLYPSTRKGKKVAKYSAKGKNLCPTTCDLSSMVGLRDHSGKKVWKYGDEKNTRTHAFTQAFPIRQYHFFEIRREIERKYYYLETYEVFSIYCIHLHSAQGPHGWLPVDSPTALCIFFFSPRVAIVTFGLRSEDMIPS